MALGDNYATLAELKTRLNVSGTGNDAVLTASITAASREIERFCRRQFNDAGEAATRIFDATPDLVLMDDCSSISNVFYIDASNNPVEIAATDYTPYPLNHVQQGVTGWPYWRLKRRGTALTSFTAFMAVNAQWGWAAVPDPVHEATLAMAEEIFKLKDAPFGVANWGEYGPMRVAENKRVMAMLKPYRRGMMVR